MNCLSIAWEHFFPYTIVVDQGVNFKSLSSFNFKPIGFIRSCYPDKFAVPRQSGLVKQTVSILEIAPEWQPEFALDGLQEFSHVWVSFVFHLNTNVKYHPKVHPPRLQGETIGVFATRSPHRPNPIGLSLATVEKIEGGCIYLGGLDLVDGTPVLDLKPYLPHLEALPEARGGWAIDPKNQVNSIRVTFVPSVVPVLEQWMIDLDVPHLETIIREIIQQDPRPVIYRGYEGVDNSPYRNEHAFRLYDGDIHFRFTSAVTAEVFQILKCQKS